VLLRLRTNEPGLKGLAEIVSAPPGKPEEFTEETVGAVQWFAAPALIGAAVEERPMGSTADIVSDDLFVEPGILRVPPGPGLGVTLGRGAVRRLGGDHAASWS
jgi:hypothetical protein